MHSGPAIFEPQPLSEGLRDIHDSKEPTNRIKAFEVAIDKKIAYLAREIHRLEVFVLLGFALLVILIFSRSGH